MRGNASQKFPDESVVMVEVVMEVVSFLLYLGLESEPI